jgi:hypothetical protein
LLPGDPGVNITPGEEVDESVKAKHPSSSVNYNVMVMDLLDHLITLRVQFYFTAGLSAL